jgi:hypothetical protein
MTMEPFAHHVFGCIFSGFPGFLRNSSGIRGGDACRGNAAALNRMSRSSSVAIFAALLASALATAQEEALFSVSSGGDDDEVGSIGPADSQTKLMTKSEWDDTLDRVHTEAEMCDRFGCEFQGPSAA